MVQNVVDFSTDPTGVQLLDDLLTHQQNNLLTTNSGTSRPAYAQNGTIWVDKTNPALWVLKMFNGTDDIIVGTLNPSLLSFTPSKVDLTNVPAADIRDKGFQQQLSAALTVTVGATGDYAEIADAVYDLHGKYYVKAKENGFNVVIQCLTGYVMQKSVLLRSVDCGWMEITSVDAEVTIDRASMNAQPAITEPMGAGVRAAFFVAGGVAPRINALFNVNTTGTATGLWAYALQGSYGFIHPDKGIKGAAYVNAMVNNGSNLVSYLGNFSGAATSANVWVNGASNALMYQATITGSASTGLKVEGGSSVFAYKADCSNANLVGLAVLSSSCMFQQGKANNCNAQAGSIGISARYGATIDAASASATGCRYGIVANETSRINATSAVASGCLTQGISSQSASMVNANAANARKGASDSTSDFVVSTGGTIANHGGTGGVSQTLNTATTNGIIYG